MKQQQTPDASTAESGRTIIEVLIVLVIMGILTAIAIPQLISARRLIRSSALPRELGAQLRFAKQQAMSHRSSVTFQYDDTTKTVRIIDHNNNESATNACNVPGTAIMADGNYPNTACSTVVTTIPLTGRIVLPAGELSYGCPAGVSVTNLSDGAPPTPLVGGKLNITFQPSGAVIDAAGNYTSKTLFIYNNKASRETAAAISVLGASGRVKVWRFDRSANLYVE